MLQNEQVLQAYGFVITRGTYLLQKLHCVQQSRNRSPPHFCQSSADSLFEEKQAQEKTEEMLVALSVSLPNLDFGNPVFFVGIGVGVLSIACLYLFVRLIILLGARLLKARRQATRYHPISKRQEAMETELQTMEGGNVYVIDDEEAHTVRAKKTRHFLNSA